MKRSTYFSGALETNKKQYSRIVFDTVKLEYDLTLVFFFELVLTVNHWDKITHNDSKSLSYISLLK